MLCDSVEKTEEIISLRFEGHITKSLNIACGQNSLYFVTTIMEKKKKFKLCLRESYNFAEFPTSRQYSVFSRYFGRPLQKKNRYSFLGYSFVSPFVTQCQRPNHLLSFHEILCRSSFQICLLKSVNKFLLAISITNLDRLLKLQEIEATNISR